MLPALLASPLWSCTREAQTGVRDTELLWEKESCCSRAQRPRRGLEQGALCLWSVRIRVSQSHASVALSPACPFALPPLASSSVFAHRLFKIHLGPPKNLEELDPNSIEYWRRLRKYNTWQRNKLNKSKKL